MNKCDHITLVVHTYSDCNSDEWRLNKMIRGWSGPRVATGKQRKRLRPGLVEFIDRLLQVTRFRQSGFSSSRILPIQCDQGCAPTKPLTFGLHYEEKSSTLCIVCFVTVRVHIYILFGIYICTFTPLKQCWFIWIIKIDTNAFTVLLYWINMRSLSASPFLLSILSPSVIRPF